MIKVLFLVAVALVVPAFFILVWLMSSSQRAEAAAVAPQGSGLPAREQCHLYLLIGQSNMAGRGELGPEDQTPDPRVLVFTLSNAWENAIEPITRDRQTGLGTGPGLAFGKAMAAKNPAITIGLIPCAVGGTPLKRWEPGGDLYSNAVRRAKLALPAGTLKGVLWHQGESDSGTAELANSYGQRLAAMIRQLRLDLGTTNLPFVAGELGEFLYSRPENQSPFAKTVNEALANLPQTVPFTAFVSSAGLKHKGDYLHFDAASQREMGRRYAAAMIGLQAAAK